MPWKNHKSVQVLGRMMNTLPQGRMSLYSMAGDQKIVSGGPVVEYIDQKTGVIPFIDHELVRNQLDALIARESQSVFGEEHQKRLQAALKQAQDVGAIYNNITLETSFLDRTTGGATSIGRQFEQVAKMMVAGAGELQTERASFIVTQDGFDTHTAMDETLNTKLSEIDSALEAFKTETSRLGLWDDVVVVTISDFGRTLTPNSGSGTDHAWAGATV